MEWVHATGTMRLDRPRIIGIVNLTPDSFSDGGRLKSLDDARRVIDQLVAEGADIIDVGAESTRPGATPVALEEEMRRLIPAVAAAVEAHPGVPVSVDTVKSRIAREALAAGASIVNDVSAMRLDAEMASVVAEGRAGVVLMHSRGDVAFMASFSYAEYGEDVVGEVVNELRASVDTAVAAGIGRDRIVIDPGVGFAKRGPHSLAVLRGLRRLGELNCPVLVGVSRKRFIGEITLSASPVDRLSGTIGANVSALERGARLFRVHDVKPHREALDVAWAIRGSGA
jgi:dihydropteroate synthase